MFDQNGTNLVEFYRGELLSLHKGPSSLSEANLRQLAKKGILLKVGNKLFLSADTCELLGVETKFPMPKSKIRSEPKNFFVKKEKVTIVPKPPKTFLQEFKIEHGSKEDNPKPTLFDKLVQQYKEQILEVVNGAGVNLVLDYESRERLLEVGVLKVVHDHGPKWQLSEKVRKVL